MARQGREQRPEGDNQVERDVRGNAELPEEPGQATESGEQGETGRSRGKVIDEQGTPMGGKSKPEGQGAGGKQHWESGRHQAD